MTLQEVLTPNDLAKIQQAFSFNVRDLPVNYSGGDGPDGVRGSAKGNILSSERTLHFDPADIPMLGGKLDLRNRRNLETVFHEVYHVKQARSFIYRLKMAWWRATLPYDKRPHEIEAREKAHILAANA